MDGCIFCNTLSYKLQKFGISEFSRHDFVIHRFLLDEVQQFPLAN
jgi:hypothetical protein